MKRRPRRIEKKKQPADGTISHEVLKARVTKAQALLDSATADGIIGQPAPEDWTTLQDGTSALLALNWALMKSHGMKESPEATRGGNQMLIMMATLMHYAYALGLRRGRSGV